MPKSETSELVTILKKLQQELQHFREDTEEQYKNRLMKLKSGKIV